jgi:hypothetical protein
MPSEIPATPPAAVIPARSKKAVTQFPAPKFTLVRDTDRGRNAHKLFKYWMELGALPLPNGQPDEKLVEVAEIRVYRCWPVIDLYVIDPQRKNIVFEFMNGACPFKDPFAYPEYFLKHFGAGDWKIVLLETGVAGPVMQALFKARGMEGAAEDLDAYPPKLDWRTITNCDENRSYINWRSRNGLPLPWEATTDEEGEIMALGLNGAPTGGNSSAVGDALRTVVESHTKLSERAVENAERIADARIAAVEHEGPSPVTVATNESIRLVTDTAKSMIDMVTSNSGKQYDPVEMLKATADIMEKNNNSDRGNSNLAGIDRILDAMEKSNARVISMYESQAQLMEKLVLAKNGDGSFGPGVVPEKQKSFSEQAKEFQTIAEVMGWSRAGQAAQAAATQAAPSGPSWFNETTAPIIVMGFQTVMVVAANIVYNWAAVKFKAGEPESPASALAKTQQALNNQNAMPGAAANPTADPQADAAAQERAGWTAFIDEFTGPFIAHLFVDPPAVPRGYTLAHFLQSDGTMAAMTANGRKNYLQLKSRLKLEGFEMLCRGHQPLWSKVGGHPNIRQFIREFMTYDEYQEKLRADAAKAAQPASEAA